MLFNSGLAKSFCGKVMVTTAYLVNVCPSSAIEFKTLEEKWSSKPSDLNHLRMFGCFDYVYQSQSTLKLGAIKCVFLDYPHSTKGYRLWIREGNGLKIINSKDVIFDETKFLCQSWTDPNSSVVSVHNPA